MSAPDDPAARAGHRVRRATAADLDTLVATLVASHVDYAWERWLLPDDATRAVGLAALVGLDLAIVGLPHGDVWLVEDGAAAAVWVPADVLLSPDDRHRLSAADAVLAARAPDAAAVGARLRDVAPPADWTLATMGTRPSHRRRGLATALLLAKLAELDRDRRSAGLETSDPGNVRLYARVGFVVTAYVDDLPGGAPATWIMHRAPA